VKDGIIKFKCDWIKAEAPAERYLGSLNGWRNKLRDEGFIGVDGEGIGFGNVSLRTAHTQFIISGTQTGNITRLENKHYALVTEYDFEMNSVKCEGPVKASSESLTHAMVYTALPDINAVFHLHSKDLWKKLLRKVPTTSKNVMYGTPAMAYEIQRLHKEEDLGTKKIFVMGGHEDGVVVFGRDPDEAGEVLFKYRGYGFPPARE
jgi:ribulose-5-phosphate 4-epimerase/fuculose-1-phosphate aldolase